ncbi:hypothetical protein LWI28_025345 [Acer negundo]|uniref:C2H2-type domain-containing protein n=1 Tax=Acer negundo TaxID=4023 RepID=A0AAD5P339_ACENE|nr:hypothetical protein LWI28_025345 [Acer negundo]KAK4856179.1 hypothetical protein QYF36_014896 [Acer negundo]
MERNSLKDHHRIGSKAIRDCNNKLIDSWNSSTNTQSSYGEDYLAGFSWPPRSYTCSFCKREFRSAQALGGHMNVHRRDRARARLRQSPPRDHGQYPFLNLNINPNPNPNPNFSTPPPVSPSFTGTLPSLVSPPDLSSLSSPSSVSSTGLKKYGTLTDDPLSPEGSDLTNKNKSFKCFLGINQFNYFTEEELTKKPAEIVRLDLEIDLISDSKDQDLDLELRLGYS